VGKRSGSQHFELNAPSSSLREEWPADDGKGLTVGVQSLVTMLRLSAPMISRRNINE
jgi:hypothetical protein